jgi:hypothetical protein
MDRNPITHHLATFISGPQIPDKLSKTDYVIPTLICSANVQNAMHNKIALVALRNTHQHCNKDWFGQHRLPLWLLCILMPSQEVPQ